MMIVSLLASAAMAAPGSTACGAETYAALTAPRQVNEKPFNLTCSVTLKKGDNIPRRIVLLGAAASGVSIDCNGGAIGYEGIVDDMLKAAGPRPNPFTLATIRINSLLQGDTWSVPSDIDINRCTIHGSTQIMSMDGKHIMQLSRKRDYTSIAQKNAPSKITISNSTLISYKHYPFYIGVGVTDTALLRSEVKGDGEGGVYLEMESANNRLVGNTFTLKTLREMIAIDGSARNVITDNRIEVSKFDGVHLYRNCGEDGFIRHQTPSHNRITDNVFVMPFAAGLRPVVVNSRTNPVKRNPVCSLDNGYDFGSSKDDNDNGTDNIVENNRVIRLSP